MKVYLYVLNTLSDWEIAYLTTELVSGRYFRSGQEKVAVVKLGSTMETVVTMGGISIRPDVSLREVTLEADDLLVLPGADLWLTNPDAEILELAKGRIEKGLRVAAICGATIALAGIGVLDAIRHTSNDKGFLKAVCPDYKGEALYQNVPAVTEKNLVTASGFAPIEFAAEIFRMLGVFKPSTLDAWLALNTKKEAQYFFELMNSLDQRGE